MSDTQRLDCLVVIARYNAAANRRMYEVLGSPAVAPRVAEPVSGYFASVMAMLNHLTLCDIAWIARVRDVWGALEVYRRHEIARRDVPGDLFASPIDDLDTIANQQADLDAVYIDLCREGGAALAAGAVPATLDFRTAGGEIETLPVEGALLHVLNHHTHHRGQIAQILDSWGVANDFSGLRTTL